MRMIAHPGGAHPIPPPQQSIPVATTNPGILGSIFQKRERKPSRTEDSGPFGRSTEV